MKTDTTKPKQSKARYLRDIPDDVYFDFQAYAKKQGKTIGAMVAEIMRERLKANGWQE